MPRECSDEFRRRSVLQTLGAMSAGGTAGCSGLFSDDQPDHATDSPADADQSGNESTPETVPPRSEHTTKLAAADGDEDDQFGASVAVGADGTTVFVGAPGDEDPNGNLAGAAYVFEQSDGAWSQQAKLVPADGDSEDRFGASAAVAADGTTALVGAPRDEDPNGEDAGSAYVFDAAGGSWTQQAKLAAADGDSTDQFGRAVAADGTTALVGAPGDEDPNGKFAGAAYVFEQSGGAWSQQAKLAPADGETEDEFGDSVAVGADGTTVLVGEEGGAVYVFEQSDGRWPQKAKLAPAARDTPESFGVSVAVGANGTTALVGANLAENPKGENAGAAYVFVRSGGSWRQQAKLTAADGDELDRFGASVAVVADGTTVFVGAPRDEEPNPPAGGAAYIFDAKGGSWTQQAKLAAPDGDAPDSFGASVAVVADGTIVPIGAPSDDEPNGEVGGAAYVFKRAGAS